MEQKNKKLLISKWKIDLALPISTYNSQAMENIPQSSESVLCYGEQLWTVTADL
jgi:hypothetical protein